MTSIEWTDETWNPVRGCSRVSEGCQNCYAEKVAARFSNPGKPYAGLAKWVGGEARWTGDVRFAPEVLDAPIRWKKPRRVFVNSMSDLFHEKVPDEWIDRIFAVMARVQWHTFQVLTKRPQRMLDWSNQRRLGLPLSNVHLGVSVENQETADERIPFLLRTPAALRFLSVEPLLGPVSLAKWLPIRFNTGEQSWERETVAPWVAARNDIGWVIVGGESGRPGARLCEVSWVRSVVEQCKAAGVPCFVKQLGAYAILDPRYYRPGATRRLRDRKGGDPNEWPDDLRVREFPS